MGPDFVRTDLPRNIINPGGPRLAATRPVRTPAKKGRINLETYITDVSMAAPRPKLTAAEKRPMRASYGTRAELSERELRVLTHQIYPG